MRIVAWVATLLCGVALGQQQPRVIAVRAGRLLDPAAQKVRTGAVVVIQDGRIQSLGDSVPAGAQVVDASALTVCPGFIDTHTHVLLQGDPTAVEYDTQLLKESLPYRTLRATRAMRIALEHGFTTLRDIGNEGAGFADVDLKKAVAAGIVVGPRLFVATKALAPTGAYGLGGTTYSWELDMPKGVQMCDGPDACRQAVRDQIAHGADWIKVYADRGYYKRADGQIRSLPNFTEEELKAIVDQAHRTNKRVAAHSMTPTGHAIALAAGVDSIEHGDVIDDATAKQMAQKKVYLSPTLTVQAFVEGPRTKLDPIWSALVKAADDSFRRALAAGVPIALGTDAGGFDWDKLNQAEEFKRYVDRGMTPWQALRSATVTAAALLGKESELGTLAPGAYGDLVGMKEDPLKDISATERVSFVMKEGVVVVPPGR
ncbi:MAG TPA: amidohydrolase family protein [Myxococcaceae bacterium]|nr:amidohydrolase family protein [Myxococcaceae bacterium]